mmetsp:Transcript_16489/g.24387  ORF Transcript_16489/g.24387 Transcript_16489/m.24387 type:complete len:109 (+) Transcript_16489:601-927(+)
MMKKARHPRSEQNDLGKFFGRCSALQWIVEHHGFVHYPRLNSDRSTMVGLRKKEQYRNLVAVVKTYNVRAERRKSVAHLHLCLSLFRSGVWPMNDSIFYDERDCWALT